jgi:preprotein translocase subunit SecF
MDNNKYTPPNLSNDNTNKIEPFDMIETKQRKPIIPNIPSVQKFLGKKNINNNNNNNDSDNIKENTLNNQYTLNPIIEEKNKEENNNYNNIKENNEQEDFIVNVKKNINQFLQNKTVSVIINPFQDSSEGVQLCYKIYSAITIFIVILVIILSICFT